MDEKQVEEIRSALSAENGSGAFLAEPLTQREKEILVLLASDLTNREISDQLSLALSTVKWYARKIYGKLGVNDRRHAVMSATALGLIEAGLPRHNLPSQPVPFVGRRRELADVQRLIRTPDCRLVTLTGMGGIGKTSLAVEVAKNMVQSHKAVFPDGVYFVSLAQHNDPGSIISETAESLNLSFYESPGSTQIQLVDYLRQKRILLILDNYEDIVGEGSSQLITELLSTSPGLKLLITSRERVNVLGEQLYPLAGMQVPEEVDDCLNIRPSLQGAVAKSTIQLFQLVARRVRPDFTVTDENVVPVTCICRMLEGMPLGIVLAASWVEALEPDEILSEIKKCPDFLETELHDLPKRQRSLRAVNNTSWKLLSESDRYAIKKLSVFRGGFSHQSALQISNISPKLLLRLVNKSWIQREVQGRYQMHELLRNYAKGQLHTDQTELLQALEDHGNYFLRYLNEKGRVLKSSQMKAALTDIDIEIDNIKTAWRWALRRGRLDLVEQNLESLCTFFDSRGRFEEGKVYCHMVAEKLERKVSQSTNSPYEHGPLSIKTLAWQAHFTREREPAYRLLNQSQDILDRTGSQGNGYLEAQALVWDFFGHHYSWEDREKSRYYFGKSQELFYQIGDEWSEAETQTDLGWVSWVIGAFEEAQSLIEASLKKHKRVGNQLGESHSLTLLAVLNKHLGRLEEAERMHRESLDLLQDLNTPWEIANGHQVYSHTLCINGKYDQALTHAHLSLQIYNDLGYSGPYKAKPHVGISSALMELGENSSARSHSQKSLQIARRNGNLQGVGISLLQLGKLALVEDDYETARQFFQESHEILVEIKQNIFIIPVAFLSLVARGFGQEDNANLYLLQSLQGVRNTTDYISGVTVLLTAAVLAVDRGQVERGIEYYALASNTPVFASSSWYKDVIQRDIVTASKSLPQEIVKAAEVRGRSLDLWETIDELYFELSE